MGRLRKSNKSKKNETAFFSSCSGEKFLVVPFDGSKFEERFHGGIKICFEIMKPNLLIYLSKIYIYIDNHGHAYLQHTGKLLFKEYFITFVYI